MKAEDAEEDPLDAFMASTVMPRVGAFRVVTSPYGVAIRHH